MSVRQRLKVAKLAAAADQSHAKRRHPDAAEGVVVFVKRLKVSELQHRDVAVPQSSEPSTDDPSEAETRGGGYWSEDHAILSRSMWQPSCRECNFNRQTKQVRGMNMTHGTIAGFKTTTLTATVRRQRGLMKTWSVAASECQFPSKSLEREMTIQPSKAYYSERMKRWKSEGKTKVEMEVLREEECDARKVAEQHVKEYMRLQKIELDLTAQQRVILMRWFNDARRTRNRALGHLTREHFDWVGNTEKSTSSIKTYLRTKFVTAEQVRNDKDKRSWSHLLRTPADIRKAAVADLVSDITRFRTNAKKRADLRAAHPDERKFQQDIKFHVAFKSREFARDSISIEAKSFNFVDDTHFSLYPKNRSYTRSEGNTNKLMRRIAIKTGKCGSLKLSAKTIQHDFKIHYAYGRFYLLAPFKMNVAQTSADVANLPPLPGVGDDVDDVESTPKDRHADYCRAPESNHRRHTQAWLDANGPAEREAMIMCDPGVHTFLSGYSPQGTIELIGTNSNEMIDKHLRRIDKWKCVEREKTDQHVARKAKDPPDATSRKEKAKVRAKFRRVRQKHAKSRRKKQDCVRNFHYNVAHRLARKYQTVGLPYYSPSRKLNRKIPVQVVRRQSALAYGKFTHIMTQVGALYANSQSARASEGYTTIQCGRCEWKDYSVGASKVFKCAKCAYRMPRDVHGARNFALRTLVAGSQEQDEEMSA